MSDHLTVMAEGQSQSQADRNMNKNTDKNRSQVISNKNLVLKSVWPVNMKAI